MHSGLLRIDSADAPGLDEARKVAAEIADAPDVSAAQAPVALIFDYDADAAWTVQPHGAGLSYFALVFDTYKALRRLGLSVDILPPNTPDFTVYKLIVAPGLMHMPEPLKVALTKTQAQVVLGPRSGARDADMCIPLPMPPAIAGLDVTVARVESLRADMPRPLEGGGAIIGYCEELEGRAEVLERTEDCSAVVCASRHLRYVGAWLDQTALKRVLAAACANSGLETLDLPDAVRLRDTGKERFWFNYDLHTAEVQGRHLPPRSVLRENLPD